MPVEHSRSRNANIVDFHLTDGILRVGLDRLSWIDETIIAEVESTIAAEMTKATEAVLIDCKRITSEVGNRFLDALIHLHQLANSLGLRVAVFNETAELIKALRAAGFEHLIEQYQSPDDYVSNSRGNSPEPLQEPVPKKATLVSFRNLDGLIVATICRTDLVLASELAEIEELLIKQLKTVRVGMLVDCRQMKGSVSSRFLSVLVRLRKAALTSGKKTAVTGITAPLAASLGATGLHAVLSFFPDLDAARIAWDAPATENQEKPLLQLETYRGIVVASILARSLTEETMIRQIEQELLDVLKSGQLGLVVDCGQLVGNVSSRFLSALIHLQAVSTKRSCRLVLCNLCSALRAGYACAGFHNVLPAYASREEACLGLARDYNEIVNEAD